MPEPDLPFGPRYRYFSVPPQTLTLRLADLADALPDAARRPAFSPYHSITFSCDEIFVGSVPRISLARLAELAPDSVTAEGFEEHRISLPPARLARSYQLLQERELLEEPTPPPAPEPIVIEAETPVFVEPVPPPIAPLPLVASADEEFAPPAPIAPVTVAQFTPPPAPFTPPPLPPAPLPVIPTPAPVLEKKPLLPPRPATVRIQPPAAAVPLPPPPAPPVPATPLPLGTPEPLVAARIKPPFVPLKKSPPSIAIPPEEPAPDVPEAFRIASKAF